jgi:hypothetical protein
LSKRAKLTRDETRRVAVNIAKLPDLLKMLTPRRWCADQNYPCFGWPLNWDKPAIYPLQRPRSP